MSGFVDLVRDAQPALYGGGCEAEATEGRTWEWFFDEIADDTGALIDMAEVTGTCAVVDRTTGATVATLTVTGGLGWIVIGKPASGTIGLASGKESRRCRWSLELTKDGVSVQGWKPSNSPFTIGRED